jgi:general secretion pathway protein G
MARHVRVLAYISLVVALIFVLGAIAALVPHSPTPGIYVPRAFNSPDPVAAGFAAVFFILPLLCVFAGLVRFKPWGRNIGLALAAILLVVPISWYALWVLTRPESKALFGVVPRPVNQPRGCLATGAYIVGAIIVIIFNLGIVSAIFKHSTNRLHPISDITTGTGSSTGGYCGMDASGKIISAEMVSVRGIVPATNPGARAYMLVDGPSLEDGIAVVVNKQFPIPAGDATLEVMAFVQCSSSSKSRLIEVTRFAWNVSPDEEKVASAKGAMWMLAISLEAYMRGTGSFPSTMRGLKALRERPNGVRLWHGPYGETPKDPWGNDYVYRYPGEHGDAPDLISLGADGRPGGTGVNADIVSWRTH